MRLSRREGRPRRRPDDAWAASAVRRRAEHATCNGSSAMNWILGLDLRSSSRGALHFAGWLAATSRSAGGERFVGVHVLEAEHLRAVLRLHHLDEVIRDARKAAFEVLAREGVSGLVREVEVHDALYADEGLEAAREHYGAHALIIGRAAERRGRRIIRLGRVARRTLRRLRSPVVVVPPDMRESDIGDGPIVALTRLAGDSVEACRLASRMARALGRPLALVHVLSPSASRRAATATLQQDRPVSPEEGEALLQAWSESHDLRPDSSTILQGHTVERAIELSRQRRAPLLVAGSHLPSTFERVVRRSTASALAAMAPLPVAVVPPA